MNPYDAPTAVADHADGRTRWFRRFLILNGVLLAIPLSVVIVVYASLRIESTMQPRTINGDPVTYVTYDHEFVGLSGPIWPIVAFFVVPNLIFLSALGLSVLRRGTSMKT